MATNEYHFITHWRIMGTVKEVAEVLLELMRRHATTLEERARIPAPPGPTFKMLIQRA